jgi:hypothetical protein
MVPSTSEISAALNGGIRLARLDAGGLNFFDRTVDGFWRSFFAAILIAPAHVLLMVISHEIPGDADSVRVIAVEAIAYLIRWLAYPAAMLIAVDMLGRRARFFDYMVPYNWSNIPQIVLLVIVTGLGTVLPEMLGQALQIVALISVLIYEGFIAKVGLMISVTAAVALVLLDLVIGLSISVVTSALLHP